MHDITEPESFAWRYAENLIKKQFEDFGFTEVRTPIVEYTQLFTRSVGEVTDIVQKEMYSFLDKNEESLSLRPEGTAPVVRALIEKNLLSHDPIQKLFYLGPMFRYERPQKGRQRQFYQYGFEVFGVAQPRQDAECVFMLVDLYEKLGLKNLSVSISSVGCPKCRPQYLEKLVKALSAQKSKLSEDSQKRLEKNPLRILDSKSPQDKEIVSKMPVMLEHLCSECEIHFEAFKNDLKTLNVNFNVNKNLVRGIDYYKRTVFEITSSSLGAQDAIGGGGRYDSLVEELGGPSTPAIGYAGGMERLIMLMDQDFEKYRPNLKYFFVTPDEKGAEKAFLLASKLRQKGVKVEIDHSGRSMKSQMKRADRLKAEKVAILGGSELEKGIVLVRDMATKQQTEVSFEDLLK